MGHGVVSTFVFLLLGRILRGRKEHYLAVHRAAWNHTPSLHLARHPQHLQGTGVRYLHPPAVAMGQVHFLHLTLGLPCALWILSPQNSWNEVAQPACFAWHGWEYESWEGTAAEAHLLFPVLPPAAQRSGSKVSPCLFCCPGLTSAVGNRVTFMFPKLRQ